VLLTAPTLGNALLTAQHRDFKSLDDADVTSCLQQLAALGALDAVLGGDEK